MGQDRDIGIAVKPGTGQSAGSPVLKGPNQGNSIELFAADVGKPPKELLRVKGTDDQARMLTAYVGFDADSLPASFFSFTRMRAVINWGIHGYSTKFSMDFCNGFSISLPASFLSISVALDDLGDAFGPNLGGKAFRIYGGVGYDALATGLKPRLTVQSNTAIIPANDSGNVFIPAFAESVVLYRTPNTVQSQLELIGVDDAAGLVDIGTFDINAGDQLANPIILPNDAHIFRVVNAGAVNITRWRAVFNLAI